MSDSPASFARVLTDELELIDKRRKLVKTAGEPETPPARQAEEPAPQPGAQADPAAAEKQVQQAALDKNLVGLAFSGGGIRSATFNLGVLQGLASLKMLRMFDFLSTVSGGGYIGGWFTAWIKREGEIDKVEKLLHPSRVVQAGVNRAPSAPPAAKLPTGNDDEPDPIYHLRSYSNYLSARLGLFSADAWSLLSIYLRNFFLNQLVILPALFALVLAVHGTVRLFDPIPTEARTAKGCWIGFAVLTMAILFVALLMVGMAVYEIDVARRRPDAPISIRTGRRLFLTWIFFPLCLGSILVTGLFSHEGAGIRETIIGEDPPDGTRWFLFIVFWSMVHGLTYLLAVSIYPRTRLATSQPVPSPVQFQIGVLSGLVGGGLLYPFIVYFLRSADAKLIATLGPPVAMMIYVLAAYVEVGLISRSAFEDLREWWASLGGWLLLFAVCWLVGFALILYGPDVVEWLGTTERKVLLSVLGWAAPTLAGVLAARSPRTGGEQPNPVLEWIAVIGPFIFLAGLFILLSSLAQWIIKDHLPQTEWHWAVLVLAPPVIAVIFSWRVDVNIFSLHGLYGNRLVRCYLGASQPKDKRKTDNPRGMALRRTETDPPRTRQPNPITGFDFNDDLPLASLRIGDPVTLPADQKPKPPDRPYRGPHLIINTAMNLTQGEELAWQERKSESFVLTPQWCGSRTTGYRSQPDYADNFLLGDAVAISGAAVSPLMGYHSSPAVAALLTYFNVRLGGWLGNPHEDTWKNDGPPFGWAYLFREMLGRANQRSPYLYLSDGGHFENLGVYELVRRRCRYIICSDADCDPDHAFENLANLVRTVRIDFGIRIDIDLTKLRLGAVRNSEWHCAVGTIHYRDVHPGAAAGLLLYIKASLTGDEPLDVRNYADANPSFPHQTTADQFFSESQFESYRALGEHITKEVIRDALGQARQEAGDPDAHEQILRHPGRLFAALRRLWFTQPPNLNVDYLTSVDGCVEFEDMLRNDKHLHRFSREVYPEESAPDEKAAEVTPEERRAEVHAVAAMLQVMENAWLRLDLDHFAAHPLHRGWMSAFRRWTNAATVRRCWPVLRGEYSQGFVRFCENELSIARRCNAVRADFAHGEAKAALMELNREFVRESPGVLDLPHRAELGLREKDHPPLAWLLSFRDAAPEKEWSPGDYPCGIIMVHQTQQADEAELLVWVRGPYRNQHVGRNGLDQVRKVIGETVRRASGKIGRLRVVLPNGTAADRTGRLDRTMWYVFFTPYGFSQDEASQHAGCKEGDLVLMASLDRFFAGSQVAAVASS